MVGRSVDEGEEGEDTPFSFSFSFSSVGEEGLLPSTLSGATLFSAFLALLLFTSTQINHRSRAHTRMDSTVATGVTQAGRPFHHAHTEPQ